ncbi:hypothetical protein NDU88_005268 [Pleurodeles waltl]|uniref:Uncharacterized protein n=1 Tax=Pleurodeles waltl TaxID=8319 RepID=A0AAV7TA42_PLEWA|nr:hypothetical protein NDU88_005268 [Pleurodeles waltl]
MPGNDGTGQRELGPEHMRDLGELPELRRAEAIGSNCILCCAVMPSRVCHYSPFTAPRKLGVASMSKREKSLLGDETAMERVDPANAKSDVPLAGRDNGKWLPQRCIKKLGKKWAQGNLTPLNNL